MELTTRSISELAFAWDTAKLHISIKYKNKKRQFPKKCENILKIISYVCLTDHIILLPWNSQLWLGYFSHTTVSGSIASTDVKILIKFRVTFFWEDWHSFYQPLVRKPLFHWRYQFCNFIFGGSLYKFLESNWNLHSHFKENCHYVLWNFSEGLTLRELGCLHSMGTEELWMNSWR